MLLLWGMMNPPFHSALLETARRLIDQGKEGDHEMAVVTAQTACEIRAEMAMTAAFARRGIEYLDDAVSDMLPSHSLANTRVRALDTALTGDEIQASPFWARYKATAELRNAIVHRGRRIGKQEAEDAYAAAVELLDHVQRVQDAAGA
jgi:hypothetical protein